MPFCFRKCGIVLSICMIFLSGLLNRAGCHLLFRSAILHRKRSFEVLALESLGPFGKFMVEVGILGFLLGTCVAYFVVVGDVAPDLVSQLIDVPNGPHLRAFVMTFLGMFVALPLGLLRNVESLSSFSTLSFILYAFLILKLFSEASSSLLSSARSDMSRKIVWWNWDGFLANLPIFAMALSCQTQLFEIFDHRSLNFDDFQVVNKLNLTVRRAVNVCSIVYIMIGTLGYIAFHEESFGGNILVHLPDTFSSTLAKIGFLVTVVISLPLCLFPCRTSLYSLFIQNRQRSTLLSDHNATAYMSDGHFRFLTITLVVFTIGVSIIVPHVEIVLGIIGSTAGATICFILPGLIYTKFLKKETTERLVARSVTYIGFFILISCTFTTLRDAQLIGSDDLIPSNPDPGTAIKSTPSPMSSSVNPIEAKTPASLNKPPIIVKQKIKSDEVKVRKKPIIVKKQEQLLKELEKQQEEHKKLLEEQKEFLREIKKHEENHVSNEQKVSSNISDDNNKLKNNMLPKVPQVVKTVILKKNDQGEEEKKRNSSSSEGEKEVKRVVEM